MRPANEETQLIKSPRPLHVWSLLSPPSSLSPGGSTPQNKSTSLALVSKATEAPENCTISASFLPHECSPVAARDGCWDGSDLNTTQYPCGLGRWDGSSPQRSPPPRAAASMDPRPINPSFHHSSIRSFQALNPQPPTPPPPPCPSRLVTGCHGLWHGSDLTKPLILLICPAVTGPEGGYTPLPPASSLPLRKPGPNLTPSAFRARAH